MKILRILMVSISLAFIFNGCEKDDPNVNPTTSITVISPIDGNPQIAHTNINLAFNVTSDNGLKRVVVKFKSATSAEIVKFDTLLASQPTSFSFSRNYTLGDVGSETYTISVTDKKDNIETKSINVKSISGFDVELFGKFYHILGTKSGAYDLIKNEEKLVTDSDNDKDIVNNDAVGVFTGGWVSNNNTMFVKAIGFDFNNGTINDAKSFYTSGTPKSNVSAPSNNDVYIAKLRGSETYVVIKILTNDILNDECGCLNKGKLTFNFKKSL
ncbi:MAG: hypothetical protein ABIO44_05275 [Saprospiraceae bacterium]